MAVYYETCDPAKAGLLDTTDQLMPYLTTYIFQEMPGVSAVYVSGAFAGALSTVSSNLSSMSNVFINDFLAKYIEHKNENFQIMISKLLIVLTGAFCIGFGYLSEYGLSISDAVSGSSSL